MSIDLPGFADPVLEAQSTFRAILTAMSRPGTLHRVGTRLTPPAPLAPAAAAALLTLADADTLVHLDPGLAPAHDWIGFHCGSLITSILTEADFVVARDCPDLRLLADGSDDGPEAGATLILQIESLDHGPALCFTGPGIEATAIIRATGLPDDFAERWARNHALFPRGVDIILCAGDRLACLPRSVQIHPGKEG